MKKFLFIFVFTLVGAVVSTSEARAINENVFIETAEVKMNKFSEQCCSVTRNGNSAKICRADGKIRKACRHALRATR